MHSCNIQKGKNLHLLCLRARTADLLARLADYRLSEEVRQSYWGCSGAIQRPGSTPQVINWLAEYYESDQLNKRAAAATASPGGFLVPGCTLGTTVSTGGGRVTDAVWPIAS